MSVTEMSDRSYKLFCYVEGDNTVFPVQASSTISIGDLKDLIKEKRSNLLRKVDAPDLILWKTDLDLDAVQDDLDVGKYQWQPLRNEKALRAGNLISNFWPEPPVTNRLHIFINLPVGFGSPTVVNAGGVMEVIPPSNLLRHYESIFIKVKEWGTFKQDDIEGNNIYVAQYTTGVPDFVINFEGMLERKPHLPNTWKVQDSGIHGYFEPPMDSTANEEMRIAGLVEVLHTHRVTYSTWEKILWGVHSSSRHRLKAPAANSLFFDDLLTAPKSSMTTAQRDEGWPFKLVMKCEGDGQLRKYHPRSDFSIMKSSLPRLLVEVNSTSMTSWPEDLIRMLLMGAFVVRFANRFVSAFQQEKDFVLCALFIWEDGDVTRYTLFEQGDGKVYYKQKELSLNDANRRVEFLRHLYNLLCVEVDQDQDRGTRDAISSLIEKVSNCLGMKSFHAKSAGNSRAKRARTGDGDGDSAGGRGTGNGRMVGLGLKGLGLKGLGHYKVKPQVYVDHRGGKWEAFGKMPSHILIVYRLLDPDNELIAKNVREESNELEILKFLHNIQPKSDHVIPLIDSFHVEQSGQWVILPKMRGVETCLASAPNEVIQVCLGLIKGLAYLHRHCIAHRDIKPDNLLVDQDFSLKIIDFDIAMQVKDEDEEVDDQCGTRGWMAPEVKMKLRHSPIKADRWCCGNLLLYLLDKFGKEDKNLRAFAENLEAYDPKHRPSLLGWSSDVAGVLSDVGYVQNAYERKALQPRQDLMEVDGENMKPPNAKKQRLDGSD